MNTAIIAKLVHSSDPMTDEEIQSSLDYYNKLDAALSPCPPEYMLVLHDVRKRLDRLNDMKKARQQGKDWAARQRTRGAYPVQQTHTTMSHRV